MAFPLVAAIGAGASLLGGAIGASSQSSANKTNMAIAKMNNEYNARMQSQQNTYNLDMWNKQNEYNTPSAQLQRYKDAGLNPNLIYGSGSASAGNAPSIQTESPKAAESVRVQPVNYFQGLAQGLNKGLDTLLAYKMYENQVVRTQNLGNLQSSQSDLALANINLVKNKAATEALNPQLIQSRIENTRVDTIYKSFLAQTADAQKDNAVEYYRNQVAAQRVAIELGNSRIWDISQKVALAWKDYDLSVKKFNVSSALDNARTQQIYQAITNLAKGADLKDIQKVLMQGDADFQTAEKVTNIISKILGGAASVGSVATKF